MKQSLRTIRKTTPVSMQALAQHTGLSQTDIFVIEAGGYTSPAKAQQVVHAFNQLSGMHLTVEDIAIHYKQEEQGGQ